MGLLLQDYIIFKSLKKQKYEVLSDKNRIREWKTPPQRGIITDFYNNVIADNQRVYQVHLSLEEVSILIIQYLN